MPDKTIKARFLRAYEHPKKPFLKSVEEVVAELNDEVYEFDTTFPEIRKQQIFEEAYEGWTLLRRLPREQAEAFYRQGCGFLNWTHGKIYDSLVPIGIERALRTGDYAFLKNAQHTWNRLNLHWAMTSSNGLDHRGSLTPVIYALADCDLDLVKLYLPESEGLPERPANHRYGATAVSLLMANLYRHSDWTQRALELAETFLGQKGAGRSEANLIRYLAALTRRDLSAASQSLQELADGYLKMKSLLHYHSSDFHVYWAAYLHGLYNAARFCVGEDASRALTRPRHPAFWNAVQDHTEAGGGQAGTLLWPLQGRLSRLRCLYPERYDWKVEG